MYSKLVTRSGANTPDEIRKRQLANVKRRGAEMQQQEEKRKVFQRYMTRHMEQVVARREYLASAQSAEDRDEFLAKWNSDRGGFMTECYNHTRTIIESFKTREDLKKRALTALGKWKQGIQRFEDARVRMSEYPIGHPEHTRIGIEMAALQVSYYTQVRVHEVELQTTLEKMRDDELGSPIDIERYAVQETERRMLADGATPEQLEAHRTTYAATLRMQTAEAYKKMMLHPGGVHCGLMLPTSVDELNATELFYVQADLWANLVSTEFYTKAFPMSKVLEEATGVAIRPQLRGPIRSTDRVIQLLGQKAQGLRNRRRKKKKADGCRPGQRPLGSGDGIREDGVRIEESDDDDDDEFFDLPELDDIDDDFFNDVREYLPKDSDDVIDTDGIFYDVQEEKTQLTEAEATALAEYFRELQMFKRQHFPPNKPPKTQDAFGRMLLDPMVLLDKIATPLTDSVEDDIRTQKDNMVGIFYKSMLAKLNNPLGLNSKDIPYLKKLMRFGRTTALFLSADWNDPDYATERLPADFKQMVRPELMAYLEATRDARSLLTVDAIRKIFDFKTSSDTTAAAADPNPVSSSGRIFSGDQKDDTTPTNPDAPAVGFRQRLGGAVVGLATTFVCYLFRGYFTGSTFDNAYQIATTTGHVARAALSNVADARAQIDMMHTLTKSTQDMNDASKKATDTLLDVQTEKISTETTNNIARIRAEQDQILATVNTMEAALHTNFQRALAGGVGANLLLGHTEGVAYIVTKIAELDVFRARITSNEAENDAKRRLNPWKGGNFEPSGDVAEMKISTDSCQNFAGQMGEVVHLLGEYAIENNIPTIEQFFLSADDAGGKKAKIFDLLRGCTDVPSTTIDVSEQTATAMALVEFQRETAVLVDAMEKSLAISAGNDGDVGEHITRVISEIGTMSAVFVDTANRLAALKYEDDRVLAQNHEAAENQSDAALNANTGDVTDSNDSDDVGAPAGAPQSEAVNVPNVIVNESHATTNADGTVSTYTTTEAYSMLDPKLFLKVTSFENLINRSFDLMVEREEKNKDISLDLARHKVNHLSTKINVALSTYKDGLRLESKNQLARIRRVFRTLRLHASIAGTMGGIEVYPEILELFGDRVAIPGSKMAIDTTRYLDSIHMEASTLDCATNGCSSETAKAKHFPKTHTPTDTEKWSSGILAIFEAFKAYSGDANTFAGSSAFTTAIKELDFVTSNDNITPDGDALKDFAKSVQTVVNPNTIETNAVAKTVVFNLTEIPDANAPDGAIVDWITSGESLVLYLENMDTDVAKSTYGNSARLMKIPGYATGKNPYKIAQWGSEYISFVSLTSVISSAFSLLGLGVLATAAAAAEIPTVVKGATTASLNTRMQRTTSGNAASLPVPAEPSTSTRVDPSNVSGVADVLVGAWFDGRANTDAFANALRIRAEGTMATYVYHAQATTEILSRGDVRELVNYVRFGPQARNSERTQQTQPNLLKRILKVVGLSQTYLDGIDTFFTENTGYRNTFSASLLVLTLALGATGWIGFPGIAIGTGLSLSAKSQLFAGTIGPAAATLFALNSLSGGRIIPALESLMSCVPYLANSGFYGFLALAVGGTLSLGGLRYTGQLNTLIDFGSEIFSELGVPSLIAVTTMSIALSNYDNDLLFDGLRHLLYVAQFTLAGTAARAVTQGLVRWNGTLNKDVLYNVPSHVLNVHGNTTGVVIGGFTIGFTPETVTSLENLTMATDSPTDEELVAIFDADNGIRNHTLNLDLIHGPERTQKIRVFHRRLYDRFKKELLIFNRIIRNNMIWPVMSGAFVQIGLHFFLSFAAPYILAGAIEGATTGSQQIGDVITYMISDFTNYLNTISGAMGHETAALLQFTVNFNAVLTTLGGFEGNAIDLGSDAVIRPIQTLIEEASKFIGA